MSESDEQIVEAKPQKKVNVVNSDVFYQADDWTESDEIWLTSTIDRMITECRWDIPEELAANTSKSTVFEDPPNQCSGNNVESQVLLEVNNDPVNQMLQADNIQGPRVKQECGILSDNQNNIVEEKLQIHMEIEKKTQSGSVSDSISACPIVAEEKISMGSHDISQETCNQSPSETWDKKIKILNCYSETAISHGKIDKLASTLNPLEAGSNCHLSVVVVPKYGKAVTQQQLKILRQTLEQKHSETVDDDSIDIPPRFRGSPLQIHGGLKLRCVDEYSLNWLKETVNLPILCEQYRYMGSKFTVIQELEMPTFMAKSKVIAEHNRKKRKRSGCAKRKIKKQHIQEELLLAAAHCKEKREIESTKK